MYKIEEGSILVGIKDGRYPAGEGMSNLCRAREERT